LASNRPRAAHDILRFRQLFSWGWRRCAQRQLLGRNLRLGCDGDMNGVRIKSTALAVLAIGALLAGWTYFRKEAAADSHRQSRQLVLHYTLSRLDQPIVIVGDSITEASSLPRTFCGHAVVNAGLDGAATFSDLGTWLIEALDGRRAAAILVALGTNDALKGRKAEAFEASYAALLAQLKTVSDHVTVLGIPSIEMRGRVTGELRDETMGRIDAFNALLPAMANKAGAAFATLPPMGAPHTIDGVHLDAAGYVVWDAAVLRGVSGICNTH
jgi:GDSL-like Lipase/Acylhydrolase family